MLIGKNGHFLNTESSPIESEEKTTTKEIQKKQTNKKKTNKQMNR